MKKIPFSLGWGRVIGNGMGFFAMGGPASEPVDLPDDFVINMERSADVVSGAASGYFPGGQATYTKKFDMPEDWAGKTVLLDVDGAYMNAEVMLNGEKIAYNPYGYTPFFADMSEFIAGSNELKVITQSRQPNSRWYAGGGLYREVNIWVGGEYYIHPWGVFVTTPVAEKDRARVRTEIEITNSTITHARLTVKARVIDKSGRAVASVEREIGANSGVTPVYLELEVDSPSLWEHESPDLYTLETELVKSGLVCDKHSTTFGIRKIEIDAENGMRVNGKPVKLRGGCIHHDNTLLGACAYPRAEERKVQILKEAGYNALRFAHNPPSRAMLDVCDRLGMYVIDESFDCWTIGKNGNDYHLWFEDWWKKDTRAMVLRDRNHPSIYCWSIGNEIAEMTAVESGGYWSKVQADYVRSLDPTRPVTAAIHGVIDFAKAGLNMDRADFFKLQGESGGKPGEINGVDYWGQQTRAASDPLDIIGYNYLFSRYEADIERFPGRVIHGTETHPLNTYDYWQATINNNNVIGDFIWTAYDNLGEAGAGRVTWSPNEGFMGEYPWLSCFQGDMDLDGNRLPQSYFRKIMWGFDDGIHLFTHHPSKTGVPFYGTGWHWPDVKQNWTFDDEYVGKPIQLDAYADCDEVEFFINGKSVGKAKPDKLTASITIPYERGRVEAVAIRGGKECARTCLVTTGAPAKLVLEADRAEICADGMDLSFIKAYVTDAEGNPICTNDIEISAEVSGAGRLAGLGSGNPCTAENYGTGKRFTYDGRALICVRAGSEAGKISVKAGAGDIKAAIDIKCK